ncbi:unnamed protein product [Phytophthora lilii]|uniref:Unnamed protein product n=1 Tax=Phytophthora lilii TaxID=2077276 RepID=A0A9W6TBR5_9STRA|nr:unnamed protein product [Phytophthora lilii]
MTRGGSLSSFFNLPAQAQEDKAMETSVHLAVVRFVLRNCVGGNVPDGVCFLVSALLLRDLSLSDACTLSRVGSVALLNLVWMRSQRHGGWSLAQLLRTEPHYFNWEFSQVLSAVTAKGDFTLVQWVLHHFPGLPIAETIVQSAAKEGKLWLLQLFEADKPHRDIEWGKKSYLKAARKGHWEVTRWLLPWCQVSYESRKQVSTLVRSSTNQLNMKELKWALANGFSIKKANMIYPPMHPKLRELFEARILEEHRRGPDDTLEKQWTDMSKMIWYMTEEELVAFSKPEWRLPARYGDLPFLKLLVSKQRNRDHRLDIAIRVGALKVAAEKGHLGIVKWLLATFSDLNESAWLSQAIFAAAESDEIEVVRWLYYKCSREPKVTLFLKHDIYVLDSESVNEVDFGDSSDDDSDSDWEDFNEDEFKRT